MGPNITVILYEFLFLTVPCRGQGRLTGILRKPCDFLTIDCNLVECLRNPVRADLTYAMKYQFADCVLDADAFTLTKGGIVQKIEPLVFDVLHLLVRNPGVLLKRDKLIEEIWDGRIVSESAISARISAARRAVGDDGKKQAIIRTVARRGIQFVADVSQDGDVDAEAAMPERRQVIRYATANDGVKIAYATSGNGPPLVRTAHSPTHLELDWHEEFEGSFFDGLGQTHNLIRFDQRGSGLSDIDVDDFSSGRAVEDLKSVVDTLELGRFPIYGSSSGAMIAVEFAAKYPERVSHLVLQGGYVDGRTIRKAGSAQKEPEIIVTMAEEGWEVPDSAFVSAYMAIYFPTATSEQLIAFARNVQNSCPVENAVRVREHFNSHSIAPVLADVKAPTLVMHSIGDAVHPLSEGKKLARGIPGAELMVLETRNHYPLPGEPSWQVRIDAIRDFLAQ
jgi:DNA-binding winged helix-turn-helix (wHTH) protein/alpha-beta hydrolase superfamily lysophospholipase